MAKRINREPSKIKEKEELKKVTSAINGGKLELSDLRDKTKEEEKVYNDICAKTNEAKEKAEKAFAELAIIEKELKDKRKQDKVLEEKMNSSQEGLNKINGTKTEIQKDIAKGQDDRDAYLKSFEIEKTNKVNELDSIKMEKLAEFESVVLTVKNEIKNLDDTLEAKKEDNLLLDSENTNLTATASLIRDKIKELNETLQTVLEVRTKSIKKAEKDALDSLTNTEKKVENALNDLVKILRETRDAQKEESFMLSKISKFKESLKLLQVEHFNLTQEKKTKIEEIKKGIETETEKLNKIRSQRFGIVKSTKELNRLYNHIKKLYESANVPMPKINVTIE